MGTNTYLCTDTTPSREALVLLGRALMAYLFIPSGWAKLVGFSGTAAYIASQGVPLPEVAAAIAVAGELGLGLLLLLGWRTRWVALGLAAFIAVITPIFHGYWNVPDAQRMMQKINFDKNLAIMGGLLALSAFGPGRWSVDGMRRAANSAEDAQSGDRGARA
jgi:putative oxidoreductase